MARNSKIHPGIMVQMVSIRCASRAKRCVNELRRMKIKA